MRGWNTGADAGPATSDPPPADQPDRQALVHGPDPLHLAEVFGLDEKKAKVKVNGKEVIFRGGEATGVFRKRLHEIP
ncbi:hypothetical protein [Streptomyces avermitilis]|uniref:hypothetical protein n=1 Tax=Streptomyces avermitilis TaxID=33903 RepID=UPI000D19DA0A|nr:hypothetical protein [Streptomyces avermitilis]